MSRRPLIAALLLATLAGCGGGNPLGNADTVENPAQPQSNRLSFLYFQRCVYPLFQARGCDAAGCHDSVNGTGGAFRLEPGAAVLDLADPANTPEVVRNSAMYRNFYSAQGETVAGTPAASRLFAKPLLLNVLHGGGLIFANEQDSDARRIAFWIQRPLPSEFSAAAADMFDPADAQTGNCRLP